MDQDYVLCYDFLSELYFETENFAEAIETVKKGLILTENHPYWRAKLARYYAATGQKKEALKIVEELNQAAKHQYISPYRIASIFGQLDDTDKFYEYMEKAVQERHWIMGFKFAPGFDAIRSDPRFVALLRKVGLKE
jgi:tetratricopeptide (TPR) repeat protein